MNYFRITYCSRNVACDPGRDMEQILRTSRRNNQAVGVTGALLFNKGYFAQVLEGPLAAVEQVFERIQLDARHCEVVVLDAASVTSRCFGDWSMAEAAVADPAEVHSMLMRILDDGTATAGMEVLTLLQHALRLTPETLAAM